MNNKISSIIDKLFNSGFTIQTDAIQTNYNMHVARMSAEDQFKYVVYQEIKKEAEEFEKEFDEFEKSKRKFQLDMDIKHLEADKKVEKSKIEYDIAVSDIKKAIELESGEERRRMLQVELASVEKDSRIQFLEKELERERNRSDSGFTAINDTLRTAFTGKNQNTDIKN